MNNKLIPPIEVIDEDLGYGGCTQCRRDRDADGRCQYTRTFRLTMPGHFKTTIFELCALCFGDLKHEIWYAGVTVSKRDNPVDEWAFVTQTQDATP